MILYSMCWEDPEILHRALEISDKDNVLSIVSGGENLLAILLKNPKNVLGIDINKEQIYLAKLKIAAIKNLGFEEFVQFLGFKNCNNRIDLLNKLKESLTNEEIKYWKNNIVAIRKGVIHCGKFERYLEKFRKYFLPLIISKKNIDNFINLESLEKQEDFFNNELNTWRFKIIFKLFFSKKGIKNGRDKEYFNYSDKNNISEHYFKRVKYAITKIPIKTNFFMQYILTGNISIPFQNHPYLDRDNFNKLKKLVDKVKFVNEDILDFIIKQKLIRFSKFNLSDIFELYSQEEYERLLKIIIIVSKKNGKVCYWNNLVSRSEHGKIDGLIKDGKKSEDLYRKDRVHFYSKFIAEDIKSNR